MKIEENGMYYFLADGKATLTKGNDVAKVEIPQNVNHEGKKYAVVAIGNCAFQFFKNLSSVTLPEGLQTIGNYAFYKCSNLSSITLPEGLQTIEDNAFNNCSSLSSITLPKSLKKIGNYALDDAYLSSITSYVSDSSLIEDIVDLSCTIYVPSYLKEDYDEYEDTAMCDSIETID